MSLLQSIKRFGKTASHDRVAYHEYQAKIGDYYFQHFVAPHKKAGKILDIGCAEGGVLAAFEKEGFDCTGLEFSSKRIEFAAEKSSSQVKFIEANIEEFSSAEQFDVILILDVIEHLDKKLQALQNIKLMLSREGIVVVSFPPFRSPFGGHQQVMKSVLKYIPYIHLVPAPLYKWLIKKIERENIDSHLRNYETGITIRQFEKLIDRVGLSIIEKLFYFVRPRQAFRFGLKIKRNRIKIGQEYLTTGVVYILS